MGEKRRRTADAAAQHMVNHAQEMGIETSWDRWDAMQPQCGFGSLGLCCRICNMGPCRIDPFGNGPQKGVCGADADTIAARNLIRMIAAGAAAHSDHGRDVAHTLLLAAGGETGDYQIKVYVEGQGNSNVYAPSALTPAPGVRTVATIADTDLNFQPGTEKRFFLVVEATLDVAETLRVGRPFVVQE